MGKLVLGLISSIPVQVSISVTRPIQVIHALERRSHPLQCGTRRTDSCLLSIVHVSAGHRHVGPSFHYCLLSWPLEPVDATDRMPSRLSLHRLDPGHRSWPCSRYTGACLGQCTRTISNLCGVCYQQIAMMSGNKSFDSIPTVRPCRLLSGIKARPLVNAYSWPHTVASSNPMNFLAGVKSPLRCRAWSWPGDCAAQAPVRLPPLCSLQSLLTFAQHSVRGGMPKGWAAVRRRARNCGMPDAAIACWSLGEGMKRWHRDRRWARGRGSINGWPRLVLAYRLGRLDLCHRIGILWLENGLRFIKL
jgi:hypothetical protein